MITHDLLPQGRDAGTRASWRLPVGRADQVDVEGVFLGVGSTHRERHPHRPAYAYVSGRDEKCSACRWFEIRVFRVDDDQAANPAPSGRSEAREPRTGDVPGSNPAFVEPGDQPAPVPTPRAPGQRGGRTHYVVHYTGASVVPGEVDFYRVQDAWSPHELIELFVIRSPGRPGEPLRDQPFMTRPGALVLAQAAHHDADLDDAWVNRAIS